VVVVVVAVAVAVSAAALMYFLPPLGLKFKTSPFAFFTFFCHPS
jgi:hypothetical protein